MIRLFQFKNNFLRENTNQLEAEYSTIGYFDGLDMQVYDDSEDEGLEILSDTYRNLLYVNSNTDQLLEACDYFNVAGMRRDSKRDEDFWNQSSKVLFFVSFLRLARRPKKLKQIIEEIEKDSDCICYTTYDSSDLIVCIKTNKYSYGCDVLSHLHDTIEMIDDKGNRLQKCFSVFAIKQTVLNEIDQWNCLMDEKVDCFFRGVVNERKKVEEFYEELVKECGVSDHKKYRILGSDDIIIAIYGISLTHLLSLYGDGAILVHSNDVYKKAFYNIRSEIAIKV